jgi:hypothetical protein
LCLAETSNLTPLYKLLEEMATDTRVFISGLKFGIMELLLKVLVKVVVFLVTRLDRSSFGSLCRDSQYYM